MDLRQLRTFLSVARTGSISAAAEDLHVAQPALTRQIQALEESLATPLFRRTTRGVVLTDAGKQLQRDAIRILGELDQARHSAIRAGRGEIGTLSLALPMMQSMPATIGALLNRFRLTSPDVSITISHLLSERQLDLLRAGQIDAGLALFRPADDPDLAGLEVFSTGMALAYPSDWSWPQGLPDRLADLEGHEFIWLPRHVAPMWHDRMIHCFYEAGFVPNATVMAADAAMMLMLVGAGLGCTIVPVSSHAPPNVSFAPLADLHLTQDWEIVWRKDNMSSVLARFLQVARSVPATGEGT